MRYIIALMIILPLCACDEDKDDIKESENRTIWMPIKVGKITTFIPLTLHKDEKKQNEDVS